jgi:hypothetical protein
MSGPGAQRRSEMHTPATTMAEQVKRFQGMTPFPATQPYGSMQVLQKAHLPIQPSCYGWSDRLGAGKDSSGSDAVSYMWMPDRGCTAVLTRSAGLCRYVWCDLKEAQAPAQGLCVTGGLLLATYSGCVSPVASRFGFLFTDLCLQFCSALCDFVTLDSNSIRGSHLRIRDVT